MQYRSEVKIVHINRLIRWPTAALQKYLFRISIFIRKKRFILVQKYIFRYKNILFNYKYIWHKETVFKLAGEQAQVWGAHAAASSEPARTRRLALRRSRVTQR